MIGEFSIVWTAFQGLASPQPNGWTAPFLAGLQFSPSASHIMLMNVSVNSPKLSLPVFLYT